jgi:3-oxoacyl-[acyl-carrier protein] reductase
MDLGLKGKGALVVGAGSDVGRATAVALAAEGARLILVGRGVPALEETAAAIGRAASVQALPGDARDAADVARFVAEARERLGGIDILVNTVGPFPSNPDVTEPMYGHDASWETAFDTLLMTAVRICREVIPPMKAAGRGAVVNLAANSARYYNPMTAQYGAMKAALTHVTKNWARDAGPHGVRVNAVLPGYIKTVGMAGMVESRARTEGKAADQVEHDMVAGHDSIFWSGRMGRPEEYADVIAYLVSDRASYINGALVPVDGGSPVW